MVATNPQTPCHKNYNGDWSLSQCGTLWLDLLKPRTLTVPEVTYTAKGPCPVGKPRIVGKSELDRWHVN